MQDKRENGIGESTLTIKWWSVVIVFILIFGWFFATILTHENRITKVETSIEVNIINMTKAIDKLSGTMEKHMEVGK